MHGSPHHFQEACRHSSAVHEETIAMWGELKGAAEHISAQIDWQGKMERNPWATMATAAVIGYVLGGGLFTRFTARIIKASSRLVLMPMLSNTVKDWMFQALHASHASVEEPNKTESYSM